MDRLDQLMAADAERLRLAMHKAMVPDIRRVQIEDIVFCDEEPTFNLIIEDTDEPAYAVFNMNLSDWQALKAKVDCMISLKLNDLSDN